MAYDVAGKLVEIKITQDFVDQRDERSKKYNARGRSEVQLRLDIECEVFEWYMISIKNWKDDSRWEIDGNCPVYGNVDVKFVKKWYNLTCQKLIYILRQRDLIEHFIFCEWAERPERLLEAGDTVKVNVLGAIKYWKVLDALRTSQFNGYYVDVKKLISKQD
jgi:hypothetical protein